LLWHNERTLVQKEKHGSVYGVMNVGDLVRMKSKYPIWLLSVGVRSVDRGIILEVHDDIDKVEVYWFRISKSYILEQRVIIKIQ
jgi:hypothetical protein